MIASEYRTHVLHTRDSGNKPLHLLASSFCLSVNAHYNGAENKLVTENFPTHFNANISRIYCKINDMIMS